MSDPDFWFDFEAASLLDLKAAGALRYATDASTRTIVLAYAIGDGPARAWHADGAILDWGHAPDDLRAALSRHPGGWWQRLVHIDRICVSDSHIYHESFSVTRFV